MGTLAIQKDINTIARISSISSILRLVSELTGMRLSLVARVTPDSWTACAVNDQLNFGLSVGGELDVATTLCKEVCDFKKAIIIECASTDPVYSVHHTPKLYQIESYIALPILRKNGEVFGTLCALDRHPIKLESKVIESLNFFTELISRQIAAEEKLHDTEQSLWDERRIGELREEFIAVLGHDMRTPLGAISLTTQALMEDRPTADQQLLLQGIDESCQQLGRLIEDVLDFARGRLGGGLTLEKQFTADVGEIVLRTVMELRRAYPRRPIELKKPVSVSAMVDEGKFRQLLSNIIGNAIQHSSDDQPVTVCLVQTDAEVRIEVSNTGSPLPPELAGNTFSPFFRRGDGKKKAGLGLGLYIASEIAKAHCGTIQADSADGTVCFTIAIPRGTQG